MNCKALSRVIAFRIRLAPKIEQLQVRPDLTMRDLDTVYRFEALGADICCAHDLGISSPQGYFAFSDSNGNPSSSSLQSWYPESPSGSLCYFVQGLVASPDVQGTRDTQMRWNWSACATNHTRICTVFGFNGN